MERLLQRRLHTGYLRVMDIPGGLRIGMPQSFGRLVSRVLASQPVEVQGLDGQWLEVRGGPLPVRVVVRIDRADDGRFMLTGLLIGLNDRREITWETLRSIKPATILGYIFSGFDPNNPAKLYADTDPSPPQSVDGESFDVESWFSSDNDGELPTDDIGSDQWIRHGRAAAALQLWTASANRHLYEDADQKIQVVTKPRASVATDLSAFAQAYLRNLAAIPHRATTTTAKELHISRATAIRRIAECREVGLLPPKRVER